MSGEAEKAKAVLDEILKKHPEMNGKITLNYFKGKLANANVAYSIVPDICKKPREVRK